MFTRRPHVVVTLEFPTWALETKAVILSGMSTQRSQLGMLPDWQLVSILWRSQNPWFLAWLCLQQNPHFCDSCVSRTKNNTWYIFPAVHCHSSATCAFFSSFPNSYITVWIWHSGDTFSLFLSIFYISQRLTLWYFVFLYLIFLSQQVLYFLLSTLVLTLYIDVVLSLSSTPCDLRLF